MDEKISATLLADFADEQICYLPRTWCRACGDATKQNKRPSACGNHEVKPCPKCRTRITTAHVDLDYVGHADVRHRLCEADPDWTWAPFAEFPGGPLVIKDGWPVGFWIQLTVGGVTKPGYGSCEKGKGEAMKELIGDALRNAALSFGVAWKLWAKGDRSGIEADQAASHAEGEAPAAPKRKRLPRNADGSVSRSRTTDEEKDAAGLMTDGQQKEHTALRKGAAEGRVNGTQRGPLPDGENLWQDIPAEQRPGSADHDRLRSIGMSFSALGVTDRGERLKVTERIVGRQLTGPHDGRTSSNLSMTEAAEVKRKLSEDFSDRGDVVAFMAEEGVPA